MTNELKIGPLDGTYDPIVVLDKDGQQLFRIDSEGNVYSKGRLVGTDEELIQATKEFIKEWTKSLNAYNTYQTAPLEEAEEFENKRNYQYKSMT